MKYAEGRNAKVELIRSRFANLIGRIIRGYELAQIWDEDNGEWQDYLDYPIYLNIEDTILSIEWDKLDELLIEYGRVLTYNMVGRTFRWVNEGNEILDSIIGSTLRSVSLGRWEYYERHKDTEMDLWIDLLLTLDNGKTLNIYNDHDKNGIKLYNKKIDWETIKCTQSIIDC